MKCCFRSFNIIKSLIFLLIRVRLQVLVRELLVDVTELLGDQNFMT